MSLLSLISQVLLNSQKVEEFKIIFNMVLIVPKNHKKIITMKKIIFLDIDGVLATPEFVENGLWALNPKKQEMFGEVLEKTSAEIVLSSSWRKSSLELTKEHMDNKGFWFTDKIIGQTIRAYSYIKKDEKIHLSIPRGVEIKQWLDTNIHSDNGKNYKRKTIGIDFNYVILDDDSDMLLEQQSYFVKCDSYEGLTRNNCLDVIDLLRN